VAKDDDVLTGFQQWLSRQPQHQSVRWRSPSRSAALNSRRCPITRRRGDLGIIKPRQAIALANCLAACQGPVLLGADANTPRSTQRTSPPPSRTGIAATATCKVKQEMTSCSGQRRSITSTTRCGAG